MPRVHQRSFQGAKQSGSSDDDVQGEGLEGAAQDNMFAKFMDALTIEDSSIDGLFSQGMARVKEYLDWSQGEGDATCLICLGQIKHSDAVWDCQHGCFAVMHLNCIQEWARSQLDAAVAKAAARLSQFPAAVQEARSKAEWGCPKCRHSYPISSVPDTYLCFCGKSTEPEWDPWLAPHTCGELCGKKLASGCQHTCLLLCHPGPCPPCPLVVDVSCYCGKASEKRRCGHPEFSCRSVCQRRLDCGHECQEECHAGECPPCAQVGTYSCACESEARKLPCSERDFHCSKPCGKKLGCGNHICEEVCHSGACGGCPFQGVRTCPCGKVTYLDIVCTEDAAPCGQTCGKLLSCGLHHCMERCHRGECSRTCRGLVMKPCRCGKSEKEMLCSNELTCERRCNNMRACGRHACKRRCCDGNCPPCEEVCGRKLRCGNHKCPAPCHTGPCRPCPLTSSIACACGRVKKQIPCGTESTTGPPTCFSQCPVPATCRHAASKPKHRCHYGPCPPCSAPCATPQHCGHACTAQSCHDPPPPPIPAFRSPKPPAASMIQQQAAAAYSVTSGKQASSRKKGDADIDLPAPAIVVAEAVAAGSSSGANQRPPSQCPPCTVLCPSICVGKHMEVNVECSKLQTFSCGKPCGQALSCGSHTCASPCHDVAATPCSPCAKSCGQPRSCSHPCGLPCHSGACPPCDMPTTLPCHCGKTSFKFSCHEAQDLEANRPRGSAGGEDRLCCQRPCHKQLPECPHICKEPCHLGVCPRAGSCEEEVSVRCECKHLKEKWACWKVRAALQVAGRPPVYDVGMPLRLIPCSKSCQQAKASGPAASASLPVAGNGEKKALAAAAADDDVPVQGAAKKPQPSKAAPQGKQRLSKAEREAAAHAEVEKRRQKEEKAKTLAIAAKVGTWAAVLVAGVLISLVIERLLQMTS